MTSYSFQCPHCGQTTAAELEALGKATPCQACGQPYLAAVPAGRLIDASGKPTGKPAISGAEQTVLVVNPAAFRENPMQTGVLGLIIVAGLTGLILFMGKVPDGAGFAVLSGLSLIAVVVPLIMLAMRFVFTRFESLTITTQRTIWARGVINRRTSEVQHDDIRNIQVQQNLVERLVRAGSIAISSAGQDDMEIVAHGIAQPRRVIETIRTYQSKMVKGD